ncbi:RNA polymerase sigma-70 factor [Mucilaginibacter sp. PAMB04168]|uniref:RNA polymerase sigma-70 factor n=1 Tax=Mucilaginibacter sp. PAMB04168 TaxID=3138567 RepID=UPI0031F6B353
MTKASNDDSLQTLWLNVCHHSDAASYEIIFHLLNAPLIKFSIQYVHTRQVAEEIVIDVFLKYWNKRTELTHVINPKTYLYTAVKNQSLNYLKKFSLVRYVELDQSGKYELIDTADPQLIMEKKELFKKLDDTIESLPPQSRMVFKLIKDDGLKYKEVAQLLEISPKTVQNHLFSAISKLNKRLKIYMERAAAK